MPASISTDPNAYELGVNFYADQSGFITAIRFYKGAGNTGTHIGHLWDNHGNLLSTATFTNETASGWQQVTLPTPVPITANTIYTASYWDPNGHYGLDSSYFNNQYDNAPLHAPAIQNGVYSFSPTTDPSGTNLSSNYWVDVVFSTTANGGGGGGSVSGSTLWGNATVPASISTDPNAYELGVNFYADQSGFITAIRFYKGAGNTGTHIGHLWDNHGNLLSTATFTNETASGWQQVTLPTPVPITANTIYTASYWDPNGHYGLDSSYFNNQYDNAPLHAPAIQNGVYSFSPTTDPSGTNLSSNYWVDVVFSSGTPSSPPPATLTLSLAPTTLSFGVVTVGSSSSLPVVITNTGNASVTVSQANITGSGFSITGPAMPLSLGSAQNASFNVTFTPTLGGNVTGNLSIVSNATNSPGVTSLSATGANQHSVSLTWAASSSPGIMGYNVYCGTVSGGPYTKLNASLVAGTTYTDGAVQAGQTYYYVTTAVDSQGVESADSNQAVAVVPSP
ncbi:MAG TPA: DUF4082 domain-containing protein [Terriglobia bacterium]|nr:DUF4082 domain-containing protein [Terriglobia bacterium]